MIKFTSDKILQTIQQEQIVRFSMSLIFYVVCIVNGIFLSVFLKFDICRMDIGNVDEEFARCILEFPEGGSRLEPPAPTCCAVTNLGS